MYPESWVPGSWFLGDLSFLGGPGGGEFGVRFLGRRFRRWGPAVRPWEALGIGVMAIGSEDRSKVNCVDGIVVVGLGSVCTSSLSATTTLFAGTVGSGGMGGGGELGKVFIWPQNAS